MNCVAAIDVDLARSPIGTRSRATREMCGTPVLTRTIQQISQANRIDHLYVLCPPEQADACRGFVPSELKSRVTVQARAVGPSPFGDVVRTARKWSLDGWRGGIGGATSFDEYAHPRELALVVQGPSADALFCAPAEAPLIDPTLIDTMIDHAEKSVDEARLTFAQAPPGLTGVIFQSDLLMEMAGKGVPPGMILSYKPDAPVMDLAHKSCCYTASESVRHACSRLVTDTRRSFETVSGFLASGLAVEAESVGRWLIERDRLHVPPLPREIEIELTTADQLPESKLRPRGAEVGARGPIDLQIVERIAHEMAAFDDSLVVLGGFGEPLLHPQFDEVLGILRDAGIYGVAVRTNGVALDEVHIESVIRHEVDVVNVLLDAWTPELYQTIQSPKGQRGADLEDIRANIKRLIEERGRKKRVAPLVVPEITKSIDTLDELDPFFDGWIRECGWANIAGYCDHAGQREDRSVMPMAPPARSACRRINQRATVLANGHLVVCDQDFTGRFPVGDLHDEGLGTLWLGEVMSRARDRHRTGHFDATPLCTPCQDWHRP
ncbi:MAG: radical SAM protein [Planctomycetes bacterium]|nr:radical SAM protein [Planctomycetota bacterium]